VEENENKDNVIKEEMKGKGSRRVGETQQELGGGKSKEEERSGKNKETEESKT